MKHTIRQYHKVRGAGRHQFDVVEVEVLKREGRSETMLVARLDANSNCNVPGYDRIQGVREYVQIREPGKRPRWVFATDVTSV